MERVYSAEINDCMIVIAAKDEIYTGVLRKSEKECFRESHENLEILKAKLHNEAGRLHPNYIGIDGAIKRFKQFFPLGFNDPFYKYKERNYKDEVVRRVSGLSVFALQNKLASQEAVLRHVLASESDVDDPIKYKSAVKKLDDEINKLKMSIQTFGLASLKWRVFGFSFSSSHILSDLYMRRQNAV